MFEKFQEQFRSETLKAKQQCEELDWKDDIQMARISCMAAEIKMKEGAEAAEEDILRGAVRIDIKHSRRLESLEQEAKMMGIINTLRNTISPFFKGKKSVERKSFDATLLVAAREERDKELSQFYEKTYAKYRNCLPSRTELEENFQYFMKHPEGQKVFKKFLEG